MIVLKLLFLSSFMYLLRLEHASTIVDLEIVSRFDGCDEFSGLLGGDRSDTSRRRLRQDLRFASAHPSLVRLICTCFL